MILSNILAFSNALHKMKKENIIKKLLREERFESHV